jgi:glyoxylase-like metal-dependent hydrolase (beta-lactamase superfamily II)
MNRVGSMLGYRIGLCAALLWSLSAGAQDTVDPFAHSTTDLGNGAYVFGNFSARSMIWVGGDGVIVTDPTSPDHARKLLDAVAAVTDQPIRYVIYSHQHWDHTLGGQIFKEAGAVFVSHQGCLKHWQRHPNAELVLPDITVDQGGQVSVQGQTVKLQYHGPNHGDCLLVMQSEGSDVLYVSDLVTPYSVGLGFMPDYDPVEWLRTLKELEADQSWQRMVGAHGSVPAPRQALVQRRRYLEALMVAVRAGMDQGKRFDDLYGSIELPEEFHSLRGYDTQLVRAAERIYYHYLMGW